jgi:hypothetical protein
MNKADCPRCQEEFIEREGRVCAGCEQTFCPNCATEFEACERCGRGFCVDCAPNYIQIPSAAAICNDCYADYIEDTDFLFE